MVRCPICGAGPLTSNMRALAHSLPHDTSGRAAELVLTRGAWLLAVCGAVSHLEWESAPTTGGAPEADETPDVGALDVSDADGDGYAVSTFWPSNDAPNGIPQWHPEQLLGEQTVSTYGDSIYAWCPSTTTGEGDYTQAGGARSPQKCRACQSRLARCMRRLQDAPSNGSLSSSRSRRSPQRRQIGCHFGSTPGATRRASCGRTPKPVPS